MTHLKPVLRLPLILFLVAAVRPAAASDANFESPPVHPVELTPNGKHLLVAHLADHRLVAYYLGGDTPYRVTEIMVGLEPVTVRARDNDEVWVVNHISDSISIVKLSQKSVVRTILVGDEPTDVVFAAGKAFVCVSQEDLIRVYDTNNLDATPTDIALATSDPRSLALSNDESTLYVVGLDSQNRTTVIPATTVSADGGLPAPVPPMNGALPPAPEVGLIVRHDGVNWVDDQGGIWTASVPYTMPDHDLIEISTSTNTVVASHSGLGTTLFNVAVHPVGGDIYVSNQEAFNEIRFEPNLKGKFLQNRVTVVSGGSVTPAHLNSHVNYAAPAGDAGERALSLSIPMDITIGANGDVFVAAFGSRKVGVLDAAGNVTRRINVGEGPAGLAVDNPRNRLYVYNRFESSVSVVNLSDDSSYKLDLGFDPSPAEVLVGRKFLYDGEISSAHGDLSCASCHVFGGMDNIPWDLGDPTALTTIPVPPGQLPAPDFHPMKGPMTTQSLKDIEGTEPLHWRGDRAVFADFNPAFVGLMGRATELSPADFQAFEDFVFSMRYPSNPNLELDGSLPTTLNGADPIHGEQLYMTGGLVGGIECVSCHALPSGENGLIIPGGALQEPEGKVVPQLRNMYEKTRFEIDGSSTVRGVGFTHNGAVTTLFEFLQFSGFTFASDGDREDVAAFLLAFPTGTPPAIGAQLTMDGNNEAQLIARLNTLEALADGLTIGLVAKAFVGGQQRGWTYAGGGVYTSDKSAEADISQGALLALAGPGQEITFTGVTEGCELRLGIDRDLDGHRDGDERDAGSDPGDPQSTPSNPPTGIGDLDRLDAGARLWLAGPNPVRYSARFASELPGGSEGRMHIYDVGGRLVRSFDRIAPGTHMHEWDLRNAQGQKVSSGVYFVRLETAKAVRVQRITVVR